MNTFNTSLLEGVESVKRYESDIWIYYVKNNSDYEIDKVGKWIFYFQSNKTLKDNIKLCENAVLTGITEESKISKPNDKYPKGVVVFYCEYDDIESHKKIIEFMMKNNLIQKTKEGRYYNISFKLDIQTLLGEYGDNFKPILKLENFINLNTGQFIV